jgi:hypothetical protein
MTEETYKQLRSEWQEKMRHAEAHLKDLEQSIVNHLDDLDIALVLLTRASELYQRLEKKDRRKLLQILVKQFIVSTDGEMINQELHSPFSYLTTLHKDLCSSRSERKGSTKIRFPQFDQSARPQSQAVEQFFEMPRFEQRDKLAELPINFRGDID